MNNLQVFENAQFGKVRTIKRNGEPWFVGKDVCELFDDTNYRRSLQRLDDDEKGVSQITTPGGEQKMTIINESGLYSLLFYMQPQKAKGVSQNDVFVNERIEKLRQFKRWVTHEILPAIRKTGQYGAALKPATVAEVVSLVKVMRETMEAQGSAPEDVAKMVEGLGEQFNIKLPKFFVRPEKTTEKDLMDMVDFIYAHPRGRGKRIPTYEDFIVHMSVKLEPKNEGSDKQCKGVGKYLRDAER